MPKRMAKRPYLLCLQLLLAIPMLVGMGCHKNATPAPDHPRLTANVSLRDVVFSSAALHREMNYRVILPRNPPAQNLPAVYLLHGHGDGFRSWSNNSDVAHFAEAGLVLIMPEGGSSYYTNAASRPEDRYEDYIVGDLISDVENRFPVARERRSRAIVGVSMGGFGAVKLGLRHPDLFVFAGGLSAAIDAPRRGFSLRRIEQSRFYEAIFGPTGSPTRHDNDPFVLLRSAHAESAPYFFLACGDQESLLAPNRDFAAQLAERHFRSEFHAVPGNHNWNQWNADLPSLFESLERELRRNQ
jgi:putative tributyrin esterase